MKDWVLTYLKKATPDMSEALLDEIKRIDFHLFDEHEDVFFGEKHKKYPKTVLLNSAGPEMYSIFTARRTTPTPKILQ